MRGHEHEPCAVRAERGLAEVAAVRDLELEQRLAGPGVADLQP
jgi:hypothetical protein